MKIVLDLQKESVQDLNKAIQIITKVKENKEQGLPFSKDLDKITNIPKKIPQQSTSRAARSAIDQEKLMGQIDMSKIYGGK